MFTYEGEHTIFGLLMFLFSKIGEKGKTVSAWKGGGLGGRKRRFGEGGRNGPSNVCTCEYMNTEK
jgi:hypothetical protein